MSVLRDNMPDDIAHHTWLAIYRDIAEHPGTIAFAIRDRLDLSHSLVNRATRLFEDLGCVTRDRTFGPGRAFKLLLTDLGWREATELGVRPTAPATQRLYTEAELDAEVRLERDAFEEYKQDVSAAIRSLWICSGIDVENTELGRFLLPEVDPVEGALAKVFGLVDADSKAFAAELTAELARRGVSVSKKED